MLRLRTTRATVSWGIWGSHDRMNTSFLIVSSALWVPAIHTTWGGHRRRLRTPAVPDATYVVSGNNLREAAGLNVADLNEAAIKEEYVGLMPCNTLSSTFPFDSGRRARGVSMAVNV
jgi:hypothetical protein